MKIILTQTSKSNGMIYLAQSGVNYQITFEKPEPSPEQQVALMDEATRRLDNYTQNTELIPQRLELRQDGKDITANFS